MNDPIKKNPKKNPGRGAVHNPPGRFVSLEYIPAEEGWEEAETNLQTEFYKDSSKSIISYNTSPDVGFNASINPYRGCEHGCVYCYARPTHEYFGLSAGLDFETKIFVKEDAPQLLRRELASPKWKPQTIALSGNTDPYQPVEQRLQITRRVLEVLAEFRNPAAIISKNFLVTRDIDILQKLAAHQAVTVTISIPTLDAHLAGVMEPRTSRPERRLEAIRRLREAGISAGILTAPVIPGLTDHELPHIVKTAVEEAGAQYAGYVILRLPHSVAELFEKWLEEHYPDRKEKVLKRIKAIRGGKLYESRFFQRMRGQGIFAEQINTMFKAACRKAGIEGNRPHLSTEAFRRPNEQLRMF
jgi:DNA repair photolyase